MRDYRLGRFDEVESVARVLAVREGEAFDPSADQAELHEILEIETRTGRAAAMVSTGYVATADDTLEIKLPICDNRKNTLRRYGY